MLLCKLGNTTGLPTIAFIGFYFGFLILLIIIIFSVYQLCTTPLVFYSYHSTPCMFPTWHHLLSLCLLLYAFAHDMVFNTCSFDSDLSIHVCLTLHATWHSPHHSLGSFWLSWILMSRSQRLELMDSPGRWSEMRSESVDHRQTVQSLFPPGPLLGSRVFHLWLVSAFLYSSLLYISLYSRICAYQRCNILVILYHILW